MALITRISRLFTADLHAVLDRIEEPDALLKQAFREMEAELSESERQLKRRTLEHDQLTARAEEIDKRLSALNHELDLCFDAGNEALARSLIRRKLEAQRLAEHLSAKTREAGKAIDELTRKSREDRERLEAMRQKAEILTDESSAETCADDAGWVRDFSISDEEVEVALLKEKHRRVAP